MSLSALTEYPLLFPTEILDTSLQHPSLSDVCKDGSEI